jgi:iron-sulfur cluster assembly accessory protein
MELITITTAARRHFVNMMEKTHQPALTLFLKLSGCNGYKYEFQFMTGDADSLHYGLKPGFDLFIDAKSVPFLTGTTIDYVRDGLSYRLVYDNPQAKGSCGCGESVNF